MPLKSWKELRQEAEVSGGTGTFEPIPAGEYALVVTKTALNPSRNGKDGYEITATVESGPYQGRKVFNTFYVSPESPKAMGIFFRHMGVFGMGNDFWEAEPTDEQILANLENKRFTGRVIIETQEGRKPRNVLADVSEPSAGGPAGVPQAGGVPTVPQVAAPAPAPAAPAPTVPQAAPAPAPAPVAPAPAPVAPAPAGDPWEAAAPAPAAGDPWSATPPPVPPMPGSN